MRLKSDSLLFKTHIGHFILSILLILLVGITLFQLSTFDKRYQNLHSVIDPLSIEIVSINNQLKPILSQDISKEVISSTLIKPLADKRKLINRYDSAFSLKINKLISAVSLHLARISDAADQNAEQETKNLLNKLHDQSAQLIIYLNEAKNQELANLNRAKSIIWWSISISIPLLLILILASSQLLSKVIKNCVNAISKPLQILSQGNLPQVKSHSFRELNPIMKDIQILSDNYAKIKDFALEVGTGKFENDIEIFNNEGEIGKSLSEMRDSLKQVAEEEKERNWTNEGFTKFGEILRQNADDLNELSNKVISHLVKYLNATQGGIFILNEDNQNKKLELSACYAYQRKKYLQKTLDPGQGLVGQCFLEKQSIYMTDLPQDYVNITSGLGGANPGNIFIIPLKLNEEVFGVMEIASFNKLKEYEKSFVEKVAESIASSISSVKVNQNTRKLLEESQSTSEQLKAQEEEMRQNMEELAATQEEMKRKQDELIVNEAKTRLIYENAFDAILTIDNKGIIDLFNPACEGIFGYKKDEITGKSFELLMPDKTTDQHKMILTDLLQNQDKSILGKDLELIGKRRNGDLFPLHLKLEDALTGDQQIFIVFMEDWSHEIKVRENMKINQQKLEQKEANLQAVINSTDDFIYAIDKEYKLTVINNVLKNKYEAEGHNLEIGTNILTVYDAEKALSWKEKYDKALSGEKFYFIDTRSDNHYIEIYLNPIVGENGDVKGTSVISRDVTDYKIDHDKLMAQLEELETTRKQLEDDKAFLSEQKQNPAQDNDVFSKFVEEQIKSQELLIAKLSENEQRLKSAIQQENYIFKGRKS